MTRRNVAVVLAGGTGTRVGLTLPKQLIKIAGKSIIEHTIAALSASPLVDEIIVMMAPGYLDPVRAIVREGGYAKVTQILEGAGTRNDTTRAAIHCRVVCQRRQSRLMTCPEVAVTKVKDLSRNVGILPGETSRCL